MIHLTFGSFDILLVGLCLLGLKKIELEEEIDVFYWFGSERFEKFYF